MSRFLNLSSGSGVVARGPYHPQLNQYSVLYIGQFISDTHISESCQVTFGVSSPSMADHWLLNY